MRGVAIVAPCDKARVGLLGRDTQRASCFDERLAHLGADFELFRANRRAQPDDDLIVRSTRLHHRRDGFLQNATDQTAPTGVRARDHRARARGEQHG